MGCVRRTERLSGMKTTSFSDFTAFCEREKKEADFFAKANDMEAMKEGSGIWKSDCKV